MKVLGIVGSIVAIIGVSWVYSKITKKEFDPKQAVIQAIIVGIILGVAGALSKKATGDTGIAGIPQKISTKV